MKRFNPYITVDDETGLDGIAMQESLFGKYVLFEDVQLELRKERERCAVECEAIGPMTPYESIAYLCAKNIRALKDGE